MIDRAAILEWVPPGLRLAKRAVTGWLSGEPELRLLPRLCDRAAISVDVGANVGIYTWHLRRLSNSVVAFEPQPDMAGFLRRALPASVTVHQAALSDRRVTLELRVPVDPDLSGNASVEATNSLEDKPFRTLDVACHRLDDLGLERIGFLKIDVEGHELSVLQGALATLERDQPSLLIEIEERHRPNALASTWAFLERLGYVGRFLRDGKLHDIHELLAPDGDAGDRAAGLRIYNFVFVPGARADRLRVG